MSNAYISIIKQNGETYEVLPTDALLSFLQRLAEEETSPQSTESSEHTLTVPEVLCS